MQTHDVSAGWGLEGDYRLKGDFLLAGGLADGVVAAVARDIGGR